MKRIVILVIAALAFCFSANAQIVSAHYYDMQGSPYFRVDLMKGMASEDADMGFGLNAAIGYYLPIMRSNFFYAPEIGLTSRFGSDKDGADSKYYKSHFGLGLKAVPIQFGYSLEITPNLSVNPRIGMGATIIPIGSVTRHNGESSTSVKWSDQYGVFQPMATVGCDFVLRDNNMILSVVMESGDNTRIGVGFGMLF